MAEQTLRVAAGETVNNLVFPLIVLLVGAAVSGYFVPRIVNAREERRKSLELKTSFVAEISEAFMSFLMSIQFAEMARRREPADAEGAGASASVKEAYDALNEAYMRWEVDSAVIGTKLEAYFPHSEVGPRWRQLSSDLSNFYSILGIPSGERRASISDPLLERYGGGDPPIDWVLSREDWANDPWAQIHTGLLEARTELIQMVLAAPVRLEGATSSTDHSTQA